MCNIDDSEIELKFHDLCRLCASYDSNKISVFGDEGKRRQLKKKIQLCFPFKVDENDALPKSLCLACTESLEITYQFRDKCIQVNRSLEKYLSKREKEKQEKTSSNQSHRIRPEVSIFAIPPTGQTSSNQNANEASSLPTDSEDGPNPLDFLEVGVNAEDNVPNARDKEAKPKLPEPEVNAEEKLDASLPPQSKERYMALYETFLSWMRSKEESSFSEDVLMSYFLEISEKFKPSTLWAQYSMLKATINCNHSVDIGGYTDLLAFLKKKSDGFTSTKAKVLTSEEVEKFLTEAPDREYLAIKVALIFGISGSCKTDELTAMTIDSIEQHGQLLLVRIPPSRNKPARSFTIDGEFYNIVKRYEALRPRKATTNRFFLNYQRGKCTTQVIGKNKFSSMPKRIAEYLELPDPKHYTGHSLSRTSTSLVTNIGCDLMTIKRHNSWKATLKASRSGASTTANADREPTSSAVLTGDPVPSTSDAGPSPAKQRRIEDPLSLNVKHEPPQAETSMSTDFDELVQYVEHEETVVMPETNRPITFKNCSNVTINFIQQDPKEKQFNNNKKQQFGWNANKPYSLSAEQRKWNAEQKVMEHRTNAQYSDGSSSPADETLNRRKNNNPRKIAREMEEGMLMTSVTASTTPRTPGLIAINIAPPIRSTVPAKGTLVRVNDMKPASRASMIASQLEASSDDNQTYSCLLCEQSFTQRTALNQHFSGVHGIEPYAMLAQHSSFGDTDGLDDELAESMVEQEVIIFCEVCRREFQDRASLWLHMVHAHREEASLSCGICLKICSDSITLIEHVNTEHSGDNAVVQRRYSCQVCGRQHDSRQKLIKHAALHTLIDNTGKAIEPQEMISLNSAYAQRDCPICHRRFFNQEKYDHHMQNFHNDSHEHPASTPSVIYKCELCASSHATRIDRWWHMYHSHSGDERVTCLLPTCLKVFVTQTLKDEHCKAHHEAQGEFTNTCEICGKLWESRTVFYKHMMNVHPKCLPTICGICMKIFSNVPELRNHVRSEHPPLEESAGICCDVCGRSYAERSKMLRHRRVHNVTDGVPFTPSMIKKKDDLQCSVCPEILFETLEDISEHRRSVHQLFVCDLCPKFYNGNNHLWKHVSKQHKGDPNVTCDICLRTSASRAHLYRHKLKYHSDPVERLIARAPGDPVPQVHKCPLCGREFRIRSLLKKHSKSCKGIKPPVQKVQPVNGVFPCSKCGKVFEQQGVLSKHMRNSHITHFCEACPDVEPKVGFEKKSDLLQHIRQQHANDPELVCDVDGCGKVLRVKADLQKHKLEHSRGYFTYICDCCGDMFSNRKKLRKHLITFHKSDVQHLCGVCIAILPSIPELAEHVQVHHPALLHRPFTCQICGKCWSVTSKTVDHITKVHGPEYKPCKICWKIFTVEKELDEHVENHPPMEEKPATPVVKKEPTTPRVRPAKSSFHNELTALGIDYDGGVLGKRAAEDDLEMDDVGGKRLRKKYKCSKCKDTFRSLLELNDHIPECNGNQVNVKSEENDEDDRSMEAYEEEKEIDPKTERWTDINPIACDCCSKVWNSKKQLWQHLIRSHIPQSMHTCGICLRVCENYYDLFYHLDAQHSNALNDSAARFACSVCGHYHNSQSKLEKHITVHKNAPQPTEYKCPYCQRNYRSVVYYREHIRVHESAERDRNAPKMETSEFSGFSINSILQKSVDEDVEDEHEDDIECEGIEDDDDDMVELENDDSDLDASNVKETSSHDGHVFRGYENAYGQSSKPTAKEKFAFEGVPPHFRSEQDEDGEAQDMDETMDEDLESNISCSTLNSTSEIQDEDEDEDMVEKESVLNGGQESSDENHGSSYGGVNNNQQKQERRVGNVDEKLNFRNSNGDNYFKRMTE